MSPCSSIEVVTETNRKYSWNRKDKTKTKTLYQSFFRSNQKMMPVTFVVVNAYDDDVVIIVCFKTCPKLWRKSKQVMVHAMLVFSIFISFVPAFKVNDFRRSRRSFSRSFSWMNRVKKWYNWLYFSQCGSNYLTFFGIIVDSFHTLSLDHQLNLVMSLYSWLDAGDKHEIDVESAGP